MLVNFRDIGEAVQQDPTRIFKATDFMGKLPEKIRPFGLLFEDVSGNVLPEEVGDWAQLIRAAMDANEWKGHLLAHVHEKYGFSDASQLQVCFTFGKNNINTLLAENTCWCTL